MKHVIVFLADGFEEIEALSVVDILRRGGIRVDTASIMGRLEVEGAHHVTVKTDVLAEEADYASADMVVLPGGGVGTQNLGKSDLVKEQCLAFAGNKLVSAICAAPTVLAGIGLLEGRNATCYPGMETEMHGAVMSGHAVTVDGQFTTGRAPGAAMAFALELVKRLEGEETARDVKKGLVYEG
ncbi:MAG: DJ-1/PfpI family protein [Parasporobacterium sp.]|nr:DJ-1/PfpI family protein [Parasporobacterium sp.]